MLQLKKFPDIPVSTREEARGFRPHSEEPRFRDEDPILLSQERFFGVPMASQEQGFSLGKARGTPGSCHHFKSPPDVSVHFRGTRFPSTASTFTPRIHSHHGGTWDSPVESLVGKPRGKATDPLIHAKGSVTQLLQHGRKAHVHAPTRTRTDSPGETPEVPQDACQPWRGILRFQPRFHTRS